ncbi:MAG: hypothetical protein KF812_06555 [Fimbriimonadaceae bacterium]|nr:hypothetical protein [Fimbriimonadaceae bacterium]
MRSLFRSSAWVFGGILLGRLLGYVRELEIGRTFGVSQTTDVIQASLVVPDLMFNLLVGGAVGAALVPEFTRRNAGEQWSLHQAALRLLAGVLLGIAVAFAVFPNVILSVIANGFSEEKQAIARPIVQLIVFVVPLTAANAITRALLNAHERFSTASLTTVVYNLALVAGVVLIANGAPYETIAIAAVAGAAAAWSVPLMEVRAASLMRAGPHQPIERGVKIRYSQALAVGVLVFFLPQIAKSAASWSGTGAYSIMHYATKLIELPLGTVLTVLGVVLFPRLARAFGTEGQSEQGSTLARSALRITLVLALAVAIPLAAAAPDFAAVLFGYGKMTPQDVYEIGRVTQGLAVGLVAQACLALLTSVANARRDMRTPLLSGVVGITVGVIVTATLYAGGALAAIASGYSAAFVTMVVAQISFLSLTKTVTLLPGLIERRILLALASIVVLGVGGIQLLGIVPSGWVRVGTALAVGLGLFVVGAVAGGLRGDFSALRSSGGQNQSEEPAT